MNKSQFDADRAFAEELQRREIEGSGAELGQLNPLPPAPPTSRSRVPNLTLPANSELVRPRSTHQVSEGNQQSVLTRITSFFQITDTATARTRAPPGSEFSLARSQSGQICTLGRTGDGNVFTFGRHSDGVPAQSDTAIAKILQSLEFEMAGEMDQADDFNAKEYAGGKCVKQMFTASTFLLFVQILILSIQVGTDGMESTDKNPMYGPPAATLVEWGAKEAALMKYRGEWWRLITPIMLHAGWMHMATNGLIQLRIGGYLNLLFGTPRWLFIYFAAGIYGTMCSFVFLPDAVGVGASGALLGNLSAWMTWIVFRWNKIPEEARAQRNCQMTVVTIALAVTLATSFAEYVDFAAHFGGAIHGMLWALVLLSDELTGTTRSVYQNSELARAVDVDNNDPNKMMRNVVVGFSGVLLIVSWVVTTWYALYKVEPSKKYMDQW